MLEATYAFEWLLGVGLGGIAVGFLVGYLVRLYAFGGTKKEAELARELSDTKEALEEYRAEVVDQYAETARKFRNLNDSYADLHQHLAQSSASLCGDQAVELLGVVAEPEPADDPTVIEPTDIAEEITVPEAEQQKSA